MTHAQYLKKAAARRAKIVELCKTNTITKVAKKMKISRQRVSQILAANHPPLSK